MNLFRNLETYIYTAAGAALLTFTAHNPALHDLSIWFLGVLGHAIGVSSAKGSPTESNVAP